MCCFKRLRVLDSVFDSQYINLSLVEQIIDPVAKGSGARLIFTGDDENYCDVVETVDYIVSTTIEAL